MSAPGIPRDFRQLMEPLVDLWSKDDDTLSEGDLIAVSLVRVLWRVSDMITVVEQRETDQVIEELEEVWKDALKTLHVAIVFATNVGTDFRERYYDKSDPMCEALVRLQARACRIASAVLVLLKAGFPDDAYARWRTLYEIEVVGAFIEKFGEEAAINFLKSWRAQLFKYQKARLDHVEQFGQEFGKDSITQQEVDEAEAALSQISRKAYGWAVDTITKNNIVLRSSRATDPNIHDLAEIVGCGHGKVPYLLGNSQVHANADSLWYSFGVNDSETTDGNDIFYGASEFGLLGPGTDSFQSLSGITKSLLAIRPDDPAYKIAAKLLPYLWNTVNKSFHEAKQKQEES